MKKFIALLLCGIFTATALTGCGSASSAGENGEVIVYNWGEYIDPETLTMLRKRPVLKWSMTNLRPTRSCIQRWKSVHPLMMWYVLPITWYRK